MSPHRLLDLLRQHADDTKTGRSCLSYQTGFSGENNVLADWVQPSDIYDLCQYVKQLEQKAQEFKNQLKES